MVEKKVLVQLLRIAMDNLSKVIRSEAICAQFSSEVYAKLVNGHAAIAAALTEVDR